MAYDIAGMMDNIRNSYKQSRLGTLAKLAYEQPDRRQSALGEMYGLNPQMAGSMKQEFDEQDKADLTNFSRTVYGVYKTDQKTAQSMYQGAVGRWGGKFRAMGIEPPQDVAQALPFFEQMAGVQGAGTPSDVQSFNYFTQGLGADDITEARRIKLGLEPKASAGGITPTQNGGLMYKDPSNGKVYLMNPGDTDWTEYRIPSAPKPSGTITNGEAAPVTLEEVEAAGEAMRRQNVPAEQINAWKAQQIAAIDAANGMGNFRQAAGAVQPPVGGKPLPNLSPKDPPKVPDAPSGYRFNPDGSLAPIPGGPADPANKPKPAAQKQAQADAVKLYAQLPALKRRIQRVADASGNLGMFGLDGGPLDQFALRYTEGGSELESSVGQLRATLLPFVRVPGVGSQSDLEARLDGLQYPGASQPPAVRKKNIDELNAFIRDLESAISNVAKQGGGSAQPPANDDDALINKYLGN